MDYKYNNEKNFQPFQPTNIISDFLSIQNITNNINIEFDAFKLIFTDSLFELLVKTSNYESILIEEYGNNYKIESFNKNSYPYLFTKNGISSKDIQKFIGALIYMGIERLPRIDIYWEQSNLFQTKMPYIISKERFKLISAFLHMPIKDSDFEQYYSFQNIEEKEEEKSESDEDEEIYEHKSKQEILKMKINEKDPRNKVLNFINLIVENSKKYVILGKSVTIDESMVFFRGRCGLRFYMPLKPTKWGLKLHCLVDSNTHYLYDLIIDPGKNNKELVAPNKDINYAHQIILTLVKELEKGHLIIFDSWYDSINLCKDLTRMGFNYISILRNNSADLPDKIKLANSSKKYAYNNEYHMKIRQYDDKKLINFVTNINLNLEELKKSYNILNHDVDKMNHVISYYNIDRKSYKW